MTFMLSVLIPDPILTIAATGYSVKTMTDLEAVTFE
jgi:hypothetical protein